jgi:BirA family biotin operon repressor/biotin-[acetyl-CoA-carboxylase] ligase
VFIRGQYFEIRGCSLLAMPEVLTAGAIRAHLTASWIGREIHCLETTDSTNSRVRDLGLEGAADGTVVTAEEQSAGRGRRGRSWVSPPGRNLYMSVLLRTDLPAEAVSQLSLLAGVAACEVLREWCDDAALKWPNDVLVGGRKVVGILSELEARRERPFVVLGIGINVNMALEEFPEDLRDKAGSLLMATGKPVDRGRVAGLLLSRLEERYEDLRRHGFAPIAERWRTLSGFLGRSIRVQEPGGIVEGKVVDLDGDGALRLRLEDGKEHRVLAGDVTVLDAYPSECER